MYSMALREASGRTKSPAILFEGIPDQDVRKRVELLDSHLQFRPLIFLSILSNKKKAATLLHPGNERRADTSTITPVGDSPRALLREYFFNDFDRWVEFDSDTEDMIAADPLHRNLLNAVHSAKSEVVRTGVMKSNMRANEDAPGFRDLVRINRLGLYVGEVATFRAQQGPQTTPLSDAV
jgi:hypothetical protein